MRDKTIPRKIIRNLAPKFLPSPKNIDYIQKVINLSLKRLKRNFIKFTRLPRASNSFLVFEHLKNG